MNRRSFLKLCGLAAYGFGVGFGTTGCTTFPKDINWSEVPDKEFSLDKFDDWFTSHKLYNRKNPNLKFGQTGYSVTFKGSINSGFSPGMDYASSKMYAVAPGYVKETGTINIARTGRLGGNYVALEHRNLDSVIPTTSTFTSHYAHLGKIHVDYGKLINRGDLIADVEYFDHAKLMFQHGYNWVDPDNYGFGHSYMDFWNGRIDINLPDMSLRDLKQTEACKKFLSFARSDVKSKLNQIEHRPVKESKFCRWDTIEIFRYLNELYQSRPQLFPDLSHDNLVEIKKEFYTNQPIILTLPLKA